MTLRRCSVLLVILAVAVGADSASGAAGDLDPSFGSGGTLTVGGNDIANDVAIQPDGKIVLAGFASDDFLVMRLNPDGSPDTTFGNGGSVVENAVGTNSQDVGDAVAIQPDGKIVVAGTSLRQNDISNLVTFLRLNANGTPDASFDPAGMTGPNPENVGIARVQMGEAFDLAIDPAGRIVYAGQNGSGADAVTFVDRLKSDGTHDDSWGNGTGDVFATTQPEFLARMALQPDGKVVVVGSIGQGTGSDVAVARTLSDGSGPDTGFGNGGRMIFGYGAGNEDGANDVVLQPDGKVVVGGFGGAGSDFTVTRLTTGGIIDSTFAGGSVLADFGGDNTGQAIALQSDGKIVLGGAASGTAFGVARFHPGGALDSTFGKGGKATVDLPTPLTPTSMAIQPDGKMVLVGGNALGQIVVARLQGDPPGSGNPGGPGGGGRVPRCAGHAATIVGTNGRDHLVGTRRADVIVALGGSDRISGGGGNDIICGGDGNDSISGGNGADKLYGQNGRDSISGGAGKDKESGGAGNDKLSGGTGNDTLSGGTGNDKLSGGAGKDKDSGGGGRDSCSGRDAKKSC